MELVINGIKIKNFRGIREAECSFKKLNFIVGQNGSGKTTLMAAISRLLPLLRKEDRIFIDGDFQFRNLTDSSTIELEYDFNLVKNGVDNSCKLKVTANRTNAGSNRSFLNDQEDSTINVSEFDYSLLDDNISNIQQRIIRNGWIGGRLAPIQLQQSEKNKHAATSEREEQVNYDSLRARMVETLKKSELSKTVAKEFPKLESEVISTCNTLLGEDRFQKFELGYSDQLFLIRKSGLFTPWQGLSGGEQSTLNVAMAIEFERKNSSQLIFFEEPETNIHPSVQKKFVDSIQTTFPSAQYFVSTHSPYIFSDHLNSANVLITKFDRFVTSDNLRPGQTLFTIPTWSEISFVAYELETFEYHNELYGVAQDLSGENTVAGFDSYLTTTFGIPQDKTWINSKTGKKTNQTITTYIRNYTHHAENTLNVAYTSAELKRAIKELKSVIQKIKP